MNKAFSKKNLAQMVECMTRVGGIAVDEISARGSATPTGEIELEMCGEMKKIALDIIGHTSFDQDFNNVTRKEPAPVAEAFTFMLEESDARCYGKPWHLANYLYWLPTTRNQQYVSRSPNRAMCMRMRVHGPFCVPCWRSMFPAPALHPPYASTAVPSLREKLTESSRAPSFFQLTAVPGLVMS